MAVIGYATLQVIPSMQGVAGNLSSQVAGPFRAVGQEAGQAVASGLQAAEAAVRQASDKLARARDKEADAAGKVTVAEAKLQALLDRGVTDAGRLAAAREAVARANRESERAAETAARAADDLADAERRVNEAGDETTGMFGRMRQGISSLGGGLDDGAKRLASFAVATAGVGSAMELASQAMGNAKLNDKLAASLGATEAEAAEYGRVTGELYRNAFGESMEDVSSAVGVVASSFDGLGKAGEASLEGATQSALNFSSIFGTDVSESVQTASQLIQNGLAKNSTEAFDLMTRSFQKVPAAMRDELPEILNEYGTNFRALGFDGPAAFELLVAAADKGKFALDKTGDALKEFTIRGSDMSKASVGAYEALQLNAQEMSDKIAQGGAGAQEALQLTAKRLLEIENPAERANTAIALFGTPVEDLSVDQIPAFLEGLAGTGNAMDGFAGSAERAGNTLNNNAATALETVKRQITGGLVTGLQQSALWITENETAAKTLAIAVGALGAAWVGFKVAALAQQAAVAVGSAAHAAATAASWTAAAARTAGVWVAQRVAAVGAFAATAASATLNAGIVAAQWVASNARAAASFVASRAVMLASATATGVITAAQWALNAAMSANPIGLVIAALVALGAGLVVAYNKSETFRNIVQGAWDGIKAAVSFAWENVIQPVLGWFGDRLTEVGDGATWLWQNAIQPAMDGIGAAINWAKDVAGTAFSAMQSGFGAVGDFFGGVGDTIGGVWDRIVISIKKAVGSIGRILQRIEIPDWVPGIGGKGTRGLGDSLVAWAAPYRAGGKVIGPGTGTSDSILARLSNGEYVVPEHAVTPQTTPLLEAMRAGWVPSAGFVDALVNGLPGFAAGGPAGDRARAYAKRHHGSPYVYGGLDCSGFLSGIYNELTGKSVRFTTGSDFAALGFQRGADKSTFTIGTDGGVGAAGHMAGSLFGVPVESSGSNGIQYGGNAADENTFYTNTGRRDKWHLPPSLFAPPAEGGGDPGPGAQDLGALGAGGEPLPGAGGGTGLGGQSGLGGSWSPGTGGSGASWSGPIPSTGGTAGGSGDTANTATGGATAEEIAKAVPVKVVNWPGSFGAGAAPAGAATVGTTGDPGAAYGAPVGTAETDGTNLAGDFAKAQADQFLSDLGVSGASGAIPKLFEQIGKLAEEMKNRPAEEHVHYHVSDMDEAVRKHTAQRREEALTWIRR